MEIVQQVTKALENIEAQLAAFSTKADMEAKFGEVSAETKAAIENFGIKQREFADQLVLIKQRGTAPPAEGEKIETWGEQFVKNARYADFAGGHLNKLRVEVKNTLTGADATVAPDRKPGIVAGAFLPFSMESLIPATTTTSNAIEFTKEASFTNSAAEAAEGAAKAESALTWSLVNMPVSTVAHFIKISKQLAADNTALAAYVNTRMVYGVNQKVDVQLVVGDGTAPNISGTYDAGNYTAHGYANAALGSTLKKLVLIRKIMADLYAAGYPADAIVLNPADWATIEIELFTTAAGQTLYNVSSSGQPYLFGLPVIQSIGMAADTFQVGAFKQAYMIHNREGVVVEMSDSDSDNFTKNLITLRAERRLALATEKPAAVRGGDLTPA
ncbi:phage major capsid protein [Propionivibrio sp.]|uniref:phage major capsid protein n=1 Tax=Propionivibrio sp. TaxID=2212460 RepID=UPI00261C9808|nr:phage major capsid protein [Propionivibrio sp.]